MNARILAAACVLLAANVVFAQDKSYPKAKVSFDDFPRITFEGSIVEQSRALTPRLIDHK